MNVRERHASHLNTLVRRRDRLSERLDEYRPDGNPEPTLREMRATAWAIKIIEELDRQGLLEDVAPG